jgi:hypothetical protein
MIQIKDDGDEVMWKQGGTGPQRKPKKMYILLYLCEKIL